ncbi:MAG: type I restriction enzyme HsdR N-terminal domain-containing protein [Actinomycetota bacterium]|nr:type I restriction enzyme HsdR N-terminal domain-containing protein [Actinomycetota bacterium]
MAVYQDKARERVAKGIRRFKIVAQKARANGAKESDTRMIVSSMVSDALGWDAFDNLTGEYRIKGSFADFVIRKDGKHFVIIEVKAVSSRLNDNHLYQAVSYAASEGVEWVILTNGAEWQLYRVLFNKPVEHELVFEVSLLDEDQKPKDKVDYLYLLTPEAQRKDELEMFYQRKRALAASNIAKLILTESVLTKLRAEIKSDSGNRVALDELAEMLVACVIRPDAQGDHVDKQLKRVQRAAKVPHKLAAEAKHKQEIRRLGGIA